MPVDKAQTPLSVKIITSMALATIFLYALVNSLMNVVVNHVVDGFSLEGTSQGLMSSMVSVGGMLALLVAPLVQGRVGKVTVLLFSAVFQAIMLIVCGLSPMFLLFCVACVLLGSGGGLMDAYANSMLADVHKENSNRYFGYLHGLFGVGSLVAPLLFAPLLSTIGWRETFFVVAAVLLAGVGALKLFTRKIQATEMEQATQEKVLTLRDLLAYGKDSRNMMMLAVGAFATATQTGILAWIMRYMALRFDAEGLGMASISLFWICATINRFSVTRLKIAPLRLLVIGGALVALCLGAGVLSGSGWGMCVAMGGLGLVSGHFMQVIFSEANKGHDGQTTLATSAMIVVMGLVRSLVPLLMAWTTAAVSVSLGMMIPAVTALGVLCIGLLLERQEKRA